MFMDTNDLIYIGKKLINYIRLRFTKRHKVAANISLISSSERPLKDILFYFPNSRFMHFGDHLFFEPLCRLFKENGMNVDVAPVKAMEEYFIYCGCSIKNKDLDKYDLVISKPDFLEDLYNLSNVLIIDTAYPNINMPLIDDLIIKLSRFGGFKKNVSSRPQYFFPVSSTVEPLLSSTDRYLIYNNYLNSGSFRVDKRKFSKLEDFVRKFKLQNPDIKIIHTGSKKDKDKDKNMLYDFVDIDLRGLTSAYDLFYLCDRPNVLYYVGFDGFIMHLFFILNKKAFVMSRGRWSPKARFFLENFIDPPFRIASPIEAIKEYI